MYKIMALLCLLTLVFVGCAGREQLGITLPGEAEEQVLFGDPYVLTFETSVSLLPLARGLADGHGSEAGVTAVGRSAAIESITEGRGDIALFGGSLPTDIENVRAIIIGSEVIHLITGITNSRQSISSSEIYALFIDGYLFDDWDDDWDDWDDDWFDDDWGDDDWDDWLDDFELPTESIALTLPGVYSRVLFEDLFHLRDNIGGVMQSLIPEDANQFGNDHGVLEFVRGNSETVGVVIATSPPEGVRTLPIDGLYPGDAGYMGQRTVVLAYRTDNPHAAAFVSALESGAFDSIFADNSVVRN